MDLRWQDPRQPNGREDKNEKMPLMRSKDKEIEQIDWSVLFNRQNVDNEKEDEFETTISGPWMKRWPMKNHNINTKSFLEKQNS